MSRGSLRKLMRRRSTVAFLMTLPLIVLEYLGMARGHWFVETGCPRSALRAG